MKVKSESIKQTQFEPFDLIISIESKRELEMFWCLLNNSGHDISKFCNAGIINNDIKEFDGVEIKTYDVWRELEKRLHQC